jgi:hypothetical protein
MTPTKCPDCGARLPSRAGHHVCAYCKREIEIVDERAKPAPKVIVVAPTRPEPEAREESPPPRASTSFGSLWSLAIMILVGASAWPAFKLFVRQSPLASAFVTWDGKTTFECGGNDDLKLEDLNVSLTGTAVIVNGNCHLRLARCTIVADTALEVGGNGRVIVEGGALTGHKHAVDAEGNAYVEVRGATLTGKVKRGGNARVNK